MDVRTENNGPVTYTVEGEQYVAVLAGWGGVFPLATGEVSFQSGRVRNISRMLAFKSGGTANLPPSEPPEEPQASPLPNRATAVTIHQGERLFQRYCAACQLDVAVSGGVLPDLRYSSALESNEWFSDALDGMLKSDGMISFAPELSREDVARVRSYVIFRRNQTLAERGKADDTLMIIARALRPPCWQKRA